MSGQERLKDLARLAADVTDAYANLVVTHTDDHVVRMSVMTEPFHWHRHPGCDETFLVLEGTVRLETERDTVDLHPGQLYTVPAGMAHVTRPLTPRSVNLTVERHDMPTERVVR